MKNLEECDFDNIKFPEDSFDYGSYLSNKIQETISDSGNNFILIPLDEEKHSEVFKKILNRAISHKKPFDERGDKWFKDSIIFESLVEFQIKNNFAKVILFTSNLKDFPEELREEFSRLTEKLLDVEANRQPVGDDAVLADVVDWFVFRRSAAGRARGRDAHRLEPELPRPRSLRGLDHYLV